jgi:hypothetical protein
MALEQHIESLRKRHAEIDMKIHAEHSRPFPSEEILSELKRKKLYLKDDISRLCGFQEAA